MIIGTTVMKAKIKKIIQRFSKIQKY